jgi:hypothetical protein
MQTGKARQFSATTSKRLPLVHLNNDETVEQAAFKAAVRGERSPDTLAIRYAICGKDSAERLTLADLAEGIINLKNNPTALSEWANFILATGETSRVRGREPDYWDSLLSGIWQLALGTRPRNTVVALAYAVRARNNVT